MKAFCGKNIVLTGCNSGIGLSFLKLIAKDNKVLCVDVNVDRLREMAARFDGLTVLQGDVSTQEGVDRVFDEAEKRSAKSTCFTPTRATRITRNTIMPIGTGLTPSFGATAIRRFIPFRAMSHR